MKTLCLMCLVAPLAYTATAQANLIVNGNFDGGVGSFVTDYIFDPTVNNERRYSVATGVPNGWAPGLGDHTTGTGNMALFNAATNTNARVWAQAVDLIAGETYDFTGWTAVLTESIRPGTNPTFAFSVAGVQVATFNSAPLDDVWQQFAFSFVASADGLAAIAIRETRGIFSGDDFALDDLSLVQRVSTPVPVPGTVWLMLPILILCYVKAARSVRR